MQIRPLAWRDGWPVAQAPLGDSESPAEASPPIGRWDHTVNDRDRYDIFFEPTGEITGTKGPAFWELAGRDLLMKWKDPQAPGGFWIDRVRLSPEERTYSGGNQQGTRITGQQRSR